jgi:ferric-dicitrate binding protein FerR (iron transport regulator)
MVKQVDDEMVVFDLQRDQVHSLNPTAAFVFRHCDGQTSPDQLSALLAAEHHLGREQAAEVMWLALDQLGEVHLLQEKVKRHGPTITRRQALKMMGVTAALLPVVASIVAPTPAQASSAGPPVGAPAGTDTGGDTSDNSGG